MTERASEERLGLVEALITGAMCLALFVAAYFHFSPGGIAIVVLASTWPLLALAWLGVRTESIERHNDAETIAKATEGFVVNSMAFFIIVLGPPLILTAYQVSVIFPTYRDALALLAAAAMVATFVGIIFGITRIGPVDEPLTAWLLLPISLTSGLLFLGSDYGFGYLVWIAPESLLRWNAIVRITISILLAASLPVLILIDIGRTIARDGLGVQAKWNELKSRRVTRSPDFLEQIKEVIDHCQTVMSYLGTIMWTAAISVGKSIGITVREIWRNIDKERWKLLAAFLIIMTVGCYVLFYSTIFAEAIYQSYWTTSYDLMLFIYIVSVFLWACLVLLLHSSVRYNRHDRTLINLGKVTFFGTLGIWVISALLHFLGMIKTGFAPGYFHNVGPFFALFGTLFLSFFVWRVFSFWWWRPAVGVLAIGFLTVWAWVNHSFLLRFSVPVPSSQLQTPQASPKVVDPTYPVRQLAACRTQ